MKAVWQLPVKQSNVSDVDWIHPKAKYHYFVDDLSVCGKHYQTTDFFETSPEDNDDKLTSENACKICYKLFEKSKVTD